MDTSVKALNAAYLLGYDAWAVKAVAGQPQVPYAYEGEPSLKLAWYNGYDHAQKVHDAGRVALEGQLTGNCWYNNMA